MASNWFYAYANSATTGIEADQRSLVRIGGGVESSRVCWSMRRNRQACSGSVPLLRLLVRLVLFVLKGLEIADELIFHAFPFVRVGLPLLNDFLGSRNDTGPRLPLRNRRAVLTREAQAPPRNHCSSHGAPARTAQGSLLSWLARQPSSTASMVRALNFRPRET